MKRNILRLGCLCLLVMSALLAVVDNAEADGFLPKLGVEGGFNLANLNGPNVNDVFASRLGWVIGAFASVPLGPLAFQPELLYEQKGGKYNGNSYQLDYVEVPLLLNISLLGPIGILLGPSFDATVANNVSNTNNSDVGLVGGVQVNLAQLLLSGRYELGLTDVNSNQNIQNGTFTFLVGFSFI
ncbi:MAG TPA: porin family protein [bacterium]|nr:porin family protein [bacterium]